MVKDKEDWGEVFIYKLPPREYPFIDLVARQAVEDYKKYPPPHRNDDGASWFWCGMVWSILLALLITMGTVYIWAWLIILVITLVCIGYLMSKEWGKITSTRSYPLV